MSEMHKNPKEWQKPFEFIPERFDSNSEYFKRPDGTPRNPLAFMPFLGGKRICLGKTFAETTLKLVLPLYFYHFDFEFVNKEDKENRPHYEIGGEQIKQIPVYFITKNKVKQNYMRGKKESTVQNEAEIKVEQSKDLKNEPLKEDLNKEENKETAIEKVKAEPIKESITEEIKEVAK